MDYPSKRVLQAAGHSICPLGLGRCHPCSFYSSTFGLGQSKCFQEMEIFLVKPFHYWSYSTFFSCLLTTISHQSTLAPFFLKKITLATPSSWFNYKCDCCSPFGITLQIRVGLLWLPYGSRNHSDLAVWWWCRLGCVMEAYLTLSGQTLFSPFPETHEKLFRWTLYRLLEACIKNCSYLGSPSTGPVHKPLPSHHTQHHIQKIRILHICMC